VYRPAAVKDGLIITLLSVLPRKLVSRTMGAGTRLALPGVVHRAILRWYVAHYGVNLDECVGGIEDYPTLAQFFTRPLLPDARPIDATPAALVSPVDARVYVLGTTEAGRIPQSPELDYPIQTLLGGDQRYEKADFAVLYLAPKDYHRVHSPREGGIVGYRYRPGELWPVFPGATARVKELFARNERLVIRVGTDVGEIAVVMVGAFGVGRMTLAFGDTVTNAGSAPEEHAFLDPIPVARGGEVGRFNMGSTVILLLPHGTIDWTVTPGQDVKLGQPLGTLKT
jgi:phosphatidylserine decarboxylase